MNLVDTDGLAHFLSRHHPEFSGAFDVARLGEGQSCLTFLVTGDGWELILRRPPRGDLPPTAFDVTREYRVTRALSGTEVPVARPFSLCSDAAVIGAPFYLMTKVEGEVVRNNLPPVLASVADRTLVSEQLVGTLVALHDLDYTEVGLADFGKPDGYLERQLHRMNQLWSLAKTRELPEIDEVGTWLGKNLPAQSGRSVVHGDYKLDNVIVSADPPVKILAVVDWEMSTLGDPLADLGWLLYFWRDPGDADMGLNASSITDQEGFLRRAALIDAYAVGRRLDGADLNWYVALAGWKIAIIMEGSYKRFLAGISDHPNFQDLEQAVPALGRRAQAAMTGELRI